MQFITRLENYLVRWIELAGDKKTYDGIKKLFVEEQYLRSCPKEMSMHLREGKPETLKDLGERAETYLEAHSADIVFGIDPKFPKIREPPQSRTCHKCGCPQSSPKSSPKRPSAPQYPSQRPSPPVPAPRSTYGETRPTVFQRGPLRCYNCNRLGHVAKDCRVRPTPTAAMEFQEYPDLRPQQTYFQQQQYPRYGNRPPYSSRPVQPDPMRNTTPPVSEPKFPTTTSTFRPPASSNVSSVTRPCRQHNVVDCE